jgi:two-component system, OmpR family, response regulator
MRILVVEDEYKIAAALKKGLEQERYTVDVSYNGQDGFDLASSETYDLLILDLMLPELDGLSISRNLRAKGSHVPILMLTAKGQIEDKVEGLDAGADDYLTKPFSFLELLARVRALSRRPKKTLGTKLTVSDLVLDPSSFIVARGGTEVKLSHKEFILLEYLMRNPAKILTKDQIIANVWNYDADVLPNTVEVYVKKLREKIDQPFPDKKPLLETVRGFGYKLGNQENV